MTALVRTVIATMSLSAAGLASLAVDENFRGTAHIPVPGDRWTYGFASTFKADGSPVKEGDKIDPVSALKLKLQHINNDEIKLRQCVKGPLYQAEYDLLVGFAYQYGVPKTCSSTLVKHINEGRYEKACQQYARWTVVDGKDCRAAGSTCAGVATRADTRVKTCLAAQVAAKVEQTTEKPVERLPIEAIAPPIKPAPVWPWAIGLLVFLGVAGAGYVVWRKRQ